MISTCLGFKQYKIKISSYWHRRIIYSLKISLVETSQLKRHRTIVQIPVFVVTFQQKLPICEQLDDMTTPVNNHNKSCFCGFPNVRIGSGWERVKNSKLEPIFSPCISVEHTGGAQ